MTLFYNTLKKRWIVAIMGVIGCMIATLGVITYIDHTHNQQTVAHRFLAEAQMSDGVHIKMTRKENGMTSPMDIEVFLYPKGEQTKENQLGFDGRLSYDWQDREYNFTLFDSRGYLTIKDLQTQELIQAACLDSDSVPPMQAFTDALSSARVVDAVVTNGGNSMSTKCDMGGKLVEFQFLEQTYVFCYNNEKSEEKVASIVGDEVSATLRILKAESNEASASDSLFPDIVSLNPPSSLNIEECKIFQTNMLPEFSTMIPNKESNLRRLTSQSLPSLHRALAFSNAKRTIAKAAQRVSDSASHFTGHRRLSFLGSKTCECTGGMKSCLFVHGLGQMEAGPITDSYPQYWGDVHTKLQCCSQVKFMRMDTVSNTWYDDILPKQVCDAAVSMTKSKNPMALENIAIISHSMGNLITAMAVSKKMCAIDKATSKWIATAGPMQGSEASNRALKICTDDPAKRYDQAIIPILESLHLCPVKPAMMSLVYAPTLDKDHSQLKASYDSAQAAYKQYVSSSMCGISSIGLVSADSSKYQALAAFARHLSKENDGAVQYDSCMLSYDASKFGSNWYDSKFYRAKLNHADLTFTHGDGWWGEDRKPVKWLNCQF